MNRIKKIIQEDMEKTRINNIRICNKYTNGNMNDRYIPNRNFNDIEWMEYNLNNGNVNSNDDDDDACKSGNECLIKDSNDISRDIRKHILLESLDLNKKDSVFNFKISMCGNIREIPVNSKGYSSTYKFNSPLDRPYENRCNIYNNNYRLNKDLYSGFKYSDNTQRINDNNNSLLYNSGHELRYRESNKKKLGTIKTNYNYKKGNGILFKLTKLKERLYSRCNTIESLPIRILDAPFSQNDFYCNIFDWGSNGLIAIGSDNKIYIYDVINEEIKHEYSLGNKLTIPNFVSSVKWNPNSTYLAVGLNNGRLYIFYAATFEVVCIFYREDNPFMKLNIYAISWRDKYCLSISSVGRIFHIDLRCSNICDLKEEKGIVCHELHKICGLKWDNSMKFLASGGYDNIVNIWDYRNVNEIRNNFQGHKSAIKALDWNNNKAGILITGGGTYDKSIKMWDINKTNNKPIFHINTGSQISSVFWNYNYSRENQFITSHGNPGNDIKLWCYHDESGTAFKWKNLFFESNRILGMCKSPNGKIIASLSEDESLSFWDIRSLDEKKSFYSGANENKSKNNVLTSNTEFNFGYDKRFIDSSNKKTIKNLEISRLTNSVIR